MIPFHRDYHWRFDRLTYLWECWLEGHLSSDTSCMSRIGWVTADAVDQAAVDAKRLFVHRIAGLRGFALREV